MWWWFIAGLGVGVVFGRGSATVGTLEPLESSAERRGNTVHRVADDLLFACSSMRPVLTRVRDLSADGRLSPQDLTSIYAVASQL